MQQLTTSAKEGVKFAEYAVGSGYDKVYAFKPGEKMGSETLLSKISGYAVTLENAVNFEEKTLQARATGLQTQLDKAQENLKTIAAAKEKLQAVVGGTQKAELDPGAPEDLRVTQAKAQLAIIEEKYEKENQGTADKLTTELAQVTTELARVQKAEASQHEALAKREQAARAAIEFVDGLHLGEVLGADNVQAFFDAINEKKGWKDGQAIDPANRAISGDQKQVVMGRRPQVA